MDSAGVAVLPEAVWSGSVACTKLLLAANANVNQTSVLSLGAFHYAAKFAESEDIIKVLVGAGANINILSNFGSSPLASTTYRDNLSAATTLLDLGAEVDSPDNEGDTPLCEALFRRANKVTRILLQRGAA